MWKNYWIQLRRVIATAKDPEGQFPYLEEFLGEWLAQRKHRACQESEWDRFPVADIKGPIHCPFAHEANHDPRSLTYVYRLRGTKGVYACADCFPYEIRWFGEFNRPTLDKLLRRG